MDNLNEKMIAEFSRRTGETLLTDEENNYFSQVKYAITVLLDYPHKMREQQAQMIIDTYDVSRRTAYKIIADAMDIFPSIERVNKDFERARLTQKIYKLLHECEQKGKLREAPFFIKLLIQINGLDIHDDASKPISAHTLVVLKSDIKSLGIELPEGFNLDTFIKDLEKDYNQKTVDVEHTEV